MRQLLKKIGITLEMIKFEHTLFALPFAVLGAILAANGLPDFRTCFWIIVAMVGARSAAMTFNRIADIKIDSQNPRTRNRELPSGKLSLTFAWGFLFVSISIFLLAAYSLNRLTFLLSPVALISILGYSYSKRFTSLSHVFLGWALAISPSAAWIAVRAALDSPVPLLLSGFVLLWTAGFDILYACQDAEFDRIAGLYSIPARLGISRALLIARVFHFVAFVVLIFLVAAAGLGWISYLGAALVGGLLVYQHTLISANDLSRMNAAFFTTNAFVSVILLVSFSAALFLEKLSAR